jgi:hypothetical protein
MTMNDVVFVDAAHLALDITAARIATLGARWCRWSIAPVSVCAVG